MDQIGFSDTNSMFKALDVQNETKMVVMQPLATLYSYRDAPAIPLSRTLMVIGVVDSSLSLVRKLTGEAQDCDNGLGAPVVHRCTIAVKRADGDYARHSKKPSDVDDSFAFATFMRRLRKEQAIVILGPLDKFAIMRPSPETTAVEGKFADHDFGAECFVVDRIRNLKEYLQYKYGEKLKREQKTRPDSWLFHMRNFNNWVKATLIAEGNPDTSIARAPLRVLDLACGKGGDLGKWLHHKRRIGNYVGVDIAPGSLVDAAIRARGKRRQLKRCTFTYADLGVDVLGRSGSRNLPLQELSTWSLQADPEHLVGKKDEAAPVFQMIQGGGIALDDKFDVVSIQFAIHYMMQTKKHARHFFRTVSKLLEIGGNLIATTTDANVIVGHLMNLGLDLHFEDGKKEAKEDTDAVISLGNGACRITFKPKIVEQIFQKIPGSSDSLDDNLFGLEYNFTLVEGSDNMSGFGDVVDLPEWLIPIPVLKALGEEVGLEIEYVQNFHEFFQHRKNQAHRTLDAMNVANQDGSISADEYEISGLYCAIKFRKVRECLPERDEEDNEPEEIDPEFKTKFFPMALMKAKKATGADTWLSLSSEEKNRRVLIEVRTMWTRRT